MNHAPEQDQNADRENTKVNEEMTAATPGQAAYEAWAGTAADWNGRLNTFQQAGWETIAQAAIATQEPCPSPELGADSDLVALAAACSHRDVLAAALARIEGLTSGYYDPGTNEYDVHEIAAGALSFRSGKPQLKLEREATL